jgi:hypothetical protein
MVTSEPNEFERIQAALKRLSQMRRLNSVDIQNGDASGASYGSGFVAGFEAAIIVADYLESMLGLETEPLVGELRAELRDLEGALNGPPSKGKVHGESQQVICL